MARNPESAAHLCKLIDENSNDTKRQPDIEKQQSDDYPLFGSARFCMAVLVFFGCSMLYCMRVNMAVAIVCMVNHTALHSMTAFEPGLLNTTVADCVDDSNNTTPAQDGPFLWPRPLQGTILSCFYWGYVTTPILGGWLAQRFGAKPVILFSIFSGSVLTMFIPLAAKLHFGVLMALQVSLGFVHGMYFSATHFFWVRWAAIYERSQLIGCSYSGQNIGTVYSMLTSGFLCIHGFDGGWPSIFYVMGMCGMVWSLVWTICSSSSPQEHRWISDKEKRFLSGANVGGNADKVLPTPWKKIFSSPAVWAINIAHTCMNFGVYVLLANLPTYMKDGLNFNIQTSGSLSAMPYIGFAIGMNSIGLITDKIRSKKLMSLIAIRKTFNTIGLLCPSCALLGLTYVDCRNAWVAVALLVIGVTGSSCVCGGFLVNHADIGPSIAGVLFGVSNTMATAVSMLGPIIAGAMTADRSPQGWYNVFYLTAGVMSFGALFFLLFGRAEVQDWTGADSVGRSLKTEEQGEVIFSRT